MMGHFILFGILTLLRFALIAYDYLIIWITHRSWKLVMLSLKYTTFVVHDNVHLIIIAAQEMVTGTWCDYTLMMCVTFLQLIMDGMYVTVNFSIIRAQSGAAAIYKIDKNIKI